MKKEPTVASGQPHAPHQDQPVGVSRENLPFSWINEEHSPRMKLLMTLLVLPATEIFLLGREKGNANLKHIVRLIESAFLINRKEFADFHLGLDREKTLKTLFCDDSVSFTLEEEVFIQKNLNSIKRIVVSFRAMYFDRLNEAEKSMFLFIEEIVSFFLIAAPENFHLGKERYIHSYLAFYRDGGKRKFVGNAQEVLKRIPSPFME